MFISRHSGINSATKFLFSSIVNIIGDFLKILNLFAGIGGNRKYWRGEITAIETNEKYALAYKKLYPNDEVIIADAYDFVLEHLQHFDFIWASPPCPSHCNLNYFLFDRGIRRYPDMKLWQLIIYCQAMLSKKYPKIGFVIENVKPFYEPFIKPSFILNRHCYWSNFPGPDSGFKKSEMYTVGHLNRGEKLPTLEKKEVYYNINLNGADLTKTEKIQALDNCVNPKDGLLILKHWKYQKTLDHYLA